MTQPSRQQYLESKVLTASQPQLHLMLLDGALRFGRQAQDAWIEADGFAQSEQSLERMFDIVEELLQGLASGEGEISVQLAEQYAFVYRQLAACRLNEDRSQLDRCIELLAYQRETWRLASEHVESEASSTPAPTTPAPTKTAVPPMHLDSAPSTAGLSLEA